MCAKKTSADATIMKMNTDMIAYYQLRAKEYEKIYEKPERQADLALAEKLIQDTFAGQEVMEIACGTGYWTQKIAVTAKSILATDINDPVLEVARSKIYSPAQVTFRKADLFDLAPDASYECLFAGFIWSHILLRDLDRLITTTHRLTKKGGTIVFIDNKYVEGSSLPIISKDEFGNTYQERNLEDGSRHMVLKNFPTESFIRELIGGRAMDIRYLDLQYYWILIYRTI